MSNLAYHNMFFDFVLYNYHLKTGKKGRNIEKIDAIVKKILHEPFGTIFIDMMTIKYKLDEGIQLSPNEIDRQNNLNCLAETYQKEKDAIMSISSLKIDIDNINTYDLRKYDEMVKFDYNKFADIIMTDN